MESVIIDCDVLGYNTGRLVAYLRAQRAEIVGITGYSRYRFAAYEAAREIKKALPRCTIIVGGRHFSALPEETLENIDEIDIVVKGEGENTLKEIYEAVLNQSPLREVAGIAFKDNGSIFSTPIRPLDKNIEKFSYKISDLPKGPYHLRQKVTLKKSDQITNPISVMTSRGCSGRCVYCCMSAGRVRYREPIAVVDEIEQKMKISGTHELSISDSSFTVNKGHVTAICDEILRRDFEIKWSCHSRANIDVNILQLMKEAGCVSVSVGVETASTKVLKAIQKKINLDQVMNLLTMCKKVDIGVLAYFMVSLPEEDEEDAETTFKFIREITPLIFKPAMQIAQIYPDAKLYEMAKEKGLLPNGFNWFKPYHNPLVKDLGGRENIPFYFDHLSVDFIKVYLKRYKKYYFKNFYYRNEFKTNIIKGLEALLLDWKNESIYRKMNRIKNGLRGLYGAFSRG